MSTIRQGRSRWIDTIIEVQPGASSIRDAFERVSAAVIAAFTQPGGMSDPLVPMLYSDASSIQLSVPADLREGQYGYDSQPVSDGDMTRPSYNQIGSTADMTENAWQAVQNILFDSSGMLECYSTVNPMALTLDDHHDTGQMGDSWAM